MNIRSFFKFLPVALILSVQPAFSVTIPARLLYNDGSHDDALVISYSAGTATYRSSAKSLNILRVKKPKLESIYFYEPKIFSEAMRLYRARDYQDAKVKFAECETTYKAVDTLPDNYATLAGFYKMECSRRMNDLEALSAELEKFRKGGLTRETHHLQLEVYIFWEAVRLKDWERLDRLALSWRERQVPSGMRTQIEYCHGLALDQLAQKDPARVVDALNAYSRAMCADATTSIEIVLEAANNMLRIYAGDDGVKLAMKLWKTEDEKAGSVGHQRLLEANSLVRLYKQAGFDKLKPLLPEYAEFLKFSGPKPEPAEPAEPESAEEDAVDAVEAVADDAAEADGDAAEADGEAAEEGDKEEE